MDMNLHAIRHAACPPMVVLWQFDEGHPMNPHGLLIAYAEEEVKPVVSDFDALMVGSYGMVYECVPDDQLKIAKWSLDRTADILASPTALSWTARWLKVLHDLAEQGEHHEFPEFGYGDKTSISLAQEIARSTKVSGAIRHGAECFNYHFPQELDEEFLIVWAEYSGEPWRYNNEPDLRMFLLERAKEGYAFPVNPVWPVRDKGWYEVLQALRERQELQAALASWFPPDTGLFADIDRLHSQYPAGFVPLQTDDNTKGDSCATARENAELIMHTAMKKSKAVQSNTSIKSLTDVAMAPLASLASGFEHAKRNKPVASSSDPAGCKDGANPQEAGFAASPSFLGKMKQRLLKSSSRA